MHRGQAIAECCREACTDLALAFVRRLIGVAAVLLVAASACSAPSTTPSSDGRAAPKAHFPLTLRDARSYFEKHSLACIGHDDPSPVVAEWLCRADDAGDRRRVRVGIQADVQGVTQLVGVADGDSAQESAPFLIATVTGLVVPSAQRDALDQWADRNADAGATRVFDDVSVELQPESDELWRLIVLPTATGSPPAD
jgi:hypothetical protein